MRPPLTASSLSTGSHKPKWQLCFRQFENSKSLLLLVRIYCPQWCEPVCVCLCVYVLTVCVWSMVYVYTCVCACALSVYAWTERGMRVVCSVCMYEYVCGVCSCVHVCLVRCTSLCVVVYAVCGMITGSHHSEHVGIRGQLSGVTSLFLPWVPGLDPGSQTCQQHLVLAEPAPALRKTFFSSIFQALSIFVSCIQPSLPSPPFPSPAPTLKPHIIKRTWDVWFVWLTH